MATHHNRASRCGNVPRTLRHGGRSASNLPTPVRRRPTTTERPVFIFPSNKSAKKHRHPRLHTGQSKPGCHHCPALTNEQPAPPTRIGIFPFHRPLPDPQQNCLLLPPLPPLLRHNHPPPTPSPASTSSPPCRRGVGVANCRSLLITR